MKRIQRSDLDRLRRKIQGVKGGRMEPGNTASGNNGTTTTDSLPYFQQEKPNHYHAEQVLDGEVIENQ